MNQVPAIYTVFDFFKNEDGLYEYNHHLVAGISTEDAEQAFRSTAIGGCTTGSNVFITTDAFREHSSDPRNGLTFLQRNTYDEKWSEEQLHRWINALTKDSYADGHLYRAAFRKI